MKSDYRCFYCLVRSFERLLEKEPMSTQAKNNFTLDMINLYKTHQEKISTPEFARNLHWILKGYTRNSDPYKAEKRESNIQALEMLPEMKEIITQSSDPFITALRLAIAGNVIDFAAGTSDIQLTTVQKLKLAGALIVTTPQEISLNDARKAASMFTNPDLKVPILGIIENMSWFTPEKHPDEIYYIFGKGGGLRLAKEFDTVLLGQIPLVLELGEAAEQGLSVFSQKDKSVVTAFENIAEMIISRTEAK